MRYDFEMFWGDSKDIIISVVDPSGADKDLTGTQWRYEISQNSFSAPSIAKAGTVSSGNEISFSLSSSDFEGVIPGKFYHEAQVEDQNGNVSTILSGQILIKRDLIR